MKRFALVALLLSAFCFAACTTGAGGGSATILPTEDAASAPETKTTEELKEPLTYKEIFDPETDFDNRFGRGIDSVVETDDAYYYASPGATYIYYYDKASGESGVLCGKPECVHDAEPNNTSCNGCVNLLGTLGYWDGRLHFLTTTPGAKRSFALMSMKPDGTDRRADAYTSLKIGDIYYSPQRLDYHRGMIYSWCKIETVHEGVPYYETCIFTIDPNTGELRKLYSVETDHTYEKPSLFYYGEYVYFYLGYIEESENGDYTTYLELRRFSAKNKEVEDLYISREDVFLGSRMNIWVESGELIYLMPYSVLDGSTSKLYKIEDGELTVAVDFGIKGTGGILDGAAFVGSTVTRQIEVRRFNGNVIFEGDWELDFLSELISGDEADRSLSNAFGDDNELLIGVWLLRKKASVPICLIKYDLTEEDPQATVIAFDPRN